MTKLSFPWLALGLGLLLSLTLLLFNPADGGRALPLLAALLMSEFGALLTGIAAVLGVRDLRRGVAQRPLVIMLTIGNLLLAAYFIRTGMALWPGSAGIGH